MGAQKHFPLDFHRTKSQGVENPSTFTTPYCSPFLPRLSQTSSATSASRVAHVHFLSQLLDNRPVIKSHLSMKTVFVLDRCTPTEIVLAHTSLSYMYVFSPTRCLNHLSGNHLRSLFVSLAHAAHTDRITRGQVQATLATPHANSAMAISHYH